MKVILKRKIEYVKSEDVDYIEDGVAYLVSGKSFSSLFIHTGSFSENTRDGSSGTYVLQKLSIEAKHNDAFSLVIGKPIIFRLPLSDGRTLLFGGKGTEPQLSSHSDDLSVMKAGYERHHHTAEFT